MRLTLAKFLRKLANRLDPVNYSPVDLSHPDFDYVATKTLMDEVKCRSDIYIFVYGTRKTCNDSIATLDVNISFSVRPKMTNWLLSRIKKEIAAKANSNGQNDFEL